MRDRNGKFLRPMPCRSIRDRCPGHGRFYHYFEPCRLPSYAYGNPLFQRARRTPRRLRVTR